MITSYDVPEVCGKLIGHIDAVGETNYDNESYNNLDEVNNLILFYLEQLLDNENRRNTHQYSVSRIADESNRILNEYREMLKE